MEVTTAVSLSQKERVLSPKRKSNFAGELVILNEGKPEVIPSNNRPVSAGKSALKRPSSGSLEVLKSDASVHSEIRKTKFQSPETGAVKQEKQFQSTEQKEKQKCSCSGTKLCQYCVGVKEKMKELSVSGVCLNSQNIKSRSLMAPRAVPSTKSFTPSNTPAIGENSNAPNESESNSNEDDTDDDDDQQGGGNREEFLSNGQAPAPNKASLELLGQFLTALMKKDYSEAQDLCDQILEVEPTNPTCLEFRSTLKEKIQHDEENSGSTDDDDDDEEEEDSDEDGDSGEDSSEDASDEDNDLSEDDKDDELAGIDVNKLNLFVGGVPVKKKSRS
ncbi:nucleolin-like [Rhopilema esculentum]|uniref:nucleolin-like n=1 Tax=Rhopilema esculentum TaxID=499914 RepID=UPI0031E2E924